MSNDVQAGALINGESYVGTEVDPSVTQREDEFTVNITGAAPYVSAEHSNASETGLPLTFAEFLGLQSEDRAQIDWRRENEARFTGFNSYGMFFEGFDHYDANGNPVDHFSFGNDLDSDLE